MYTVTVERKLVSHIQLSLLEMKQLFEKQNPQEGAGRKSTTETYPNITGFLDGNMAIPLRSYIGLHQPLASEKSAISSKQIIP